MFVFTLLFLFILRLKFPSHKSINRIILERYNEEVLSTFRNFNKYDLKLRKLDSDLDFLTKCFSNNLTPNFLEFKLYSCALRGGSDYKKFQKKLLNDELQLKRDELQDAKLYRSRYNRLFVIKR